jgi:hypothetical protein
MEIVDEIKKPTFASDPDFTMSRKQNPISFKFKCKTCDSALEIVFQAQINNFWAGKTERITEEDLNVVKAFYSIGLTQKSHDGGRAVFDKVICSACATPYMTYCGVSEFSNSAFNVQVHGILRLRKGK